MSVFVNPLRSNKAKFKEEIELQIHNHKKVATYLEAATQSHREAAKHYENGNYELATLSNLEANNQIELAIERKKRLVKSSL
ncbi:MAG: hypothetical protein IPH32_15715 [Bacteroidetes bacterium]|nr:hypothetical protein [Bacteroidota bacterium]